MKEQTLLEIKNKVDASTRILQQIIPELTRLRELGVGTLETLKLMPGYQDAIDQLKQTMEDNVEEKKKAEQNGISE
jgi:hypothetical protein